MADSVLVTTQKETRLVSVGTQGPVGPQGIQGLVGPTGPAGTTDYAQLTNKPVLGTSSTKDVAASGNASAVQVVMGSDSRLTNTRTPTAHTHVIADVTGLQSALNAKSAGLTLTTTSANKPLVVNELCVVTVGGVALTPPVAAANALFGVVVPTACSGTYLNGTGTTIMGIANDSQVKLDLLEGVSPVTYLFRYNSTTGWTLE